MRPNNSFKPTPHRGVGRVLYATLVYCFEINEPFHFGTVIVCTAPVDE